MQWYNPPAAWKEENGSLSVTTAAHSDFWRKTHYGFIRDNGHFYYQDAPGDFILEVRVDGQYKDRYDQAGLMLRVDAANWIKTGIEFFDGHQHVSAVVTREFSDWSVIRLAAPQPSLWLRVTRVAETVQVFYALDGQNYSLLRLAYLQPSAVTQVGPMCASPDGAGFDILFHDFTVKPNA